MLRFWGELSAKLDDFYGNYREYVEHVQKFWDDYKNRDPQMASHHLMECEAFQGNFQDAYNSLQGRWRNSEQLDKMWNMVAKSAEHLGVMNEKLDDLWDKQKRW